MNNLTRLFYHKFFLLVLVNAGISFVLSGCGATHRATAEKDNSVTSPEIDRNSRKMLLRDEGLSQLSYIDLADSTNNWFVKVPAGRDIQLSGNGRVLIGTGKGYEERDITTGAKVNEVTAFEGTIAATRLRNGNTLLTGLNWQGKQGIVLVEVDKSGSIVRTINYPAYSYVRLVRQTVSNTFLVVADDTVFEGNAAGKITWQAKLTGRDKPHAWQASRLTNGQTIVSAGYDANFQLFGADGGFIKSFTGPAAVNPNFFAGFQTLANGNYVVTNWQGHGPAFGASGQQVLEFTPGGEMVWSWKQYPAKYSSLQGVIVLDKLDISKLHVESAGGVLKAVE